MTKSLNALIIFLLFGLACIFFYTINTNKQCVLYTDYGRFYQSDQLAIGKQDIYLPVYVADTHRPHAAPTKISDNLNPPFFQLLSYPFGLVSYAHSLCLWSLLSVFCAAISVIFAWKILEEKPTSLLFSSSLLAVFAFAPIYTTLQCGQVSLVLLLPLSIAWFLAKQGRTNASAVLVGIAASCKPFLLLFGLFYFLRREWSGLLCFTLTILVCLALSILMFGIPSYISYSQTLHHIAWYADNWNASLYGTLARLFGTHYEKHALLTHAPGLTSWLYYTLSFELIIFMTFLIGTKKIIAIADKKEKLDFDFTITLVLALLLSPLGWTYYFTFLIIPFMLLFKKLYQQNLNYTYALYLLPTFFFANLGSTLITSNKLTPQNINLNFLLGSGYFLSLVGLLFVAIKFYNPTLDKTQISQQSQIGKFELTVLIVIIMLPSLLGTLWQINQFAIGGDRLISTFNEVFFSS